MPKMTAAQERYQEEMKAEPALLEQAREINGRLDRLVAMKVADLVLAHLEAKPKVDAVRMSFSEMDFDNGLFVVPDELVSIVDGEEVEGKAEQKMFDVLTDTNLNEFRETLLHSDEDEGFTITREQAEAHGFDREKIAIDLGLIENPAPASRKRARH